MIIPYRTRRILQRIGIACLFLLIAMVIGWLCCVIWLERFVVYTRDGAVLNFELSAELPVGEVAAPPSNDSSIEIYYHEGSNAVETNRDLTQMQGYYIDGTALAADTAGCRDRLGTLEAGTPVMIDVKSIDGSFYYSSDLAEAEPSGTVDIAAVDSLISQIVSGDYYAIARVPAFRDRNFGLNHVSSGLPLPAGYLWMDSKGCYWLNPTDTGTLNWLMQIIEELKLMGFDEVVLSEFRFPDTDKIVFKADKNEALTNAMNTLLTSCGTSSFTLSFCVSNPSFALPEGRTRLYLDSVAASDVGSTAAQVTVTDPQIRLVFITEANDTRYNEYSVLRPLSAAEVLEEPENE